MLGNFVDAPFSPPSTLVTRSQIALFSSPCSIGYSVPAPPAAIAALAGASLINLFDKMPLLASYTLGGLTFWITMIKVVIGSLIVAFALLELSPRFQALAFTEVATARRCAVRFLWWPVREPRRTALGLPVEKWPIERGIRRYRCRFSRHRRCCTIGDLWR